MESFKLASASRAGKGPFGVLVQGERALPLEPARHSLS